MSQTGPWSVKGIDQRAREAAREAAREEGMTLGAYLNSLILNSDQEEPPAPDAETAHPVDAMSASPATPARGDTLDKLVRRIEATEARSTLAITGIDQSVVGLVRRLEEAENTQSAVINHVDGVMDDMRSTHDALREKVDTLESDDSSEKNLEALKSLENALGKLASHVYEENELSQSEAEAIKGRVESGLADIEDRMGQMDSKVETTLSDAAQRVEKAVEQAELRAEGAARHLSDRFTTLEHDVTNKLSNLGDLEEKITKVDAIESDVSGAIDSMENTLLRIQDRLNRAETTTDSALKALETSFASLDERIEAVADAANPEAAIELRKQFEARFEGLADELRANIAETRAELATEIEKAAISGIDPEKMDFFETAIEDMQRRMSESDERQSRAIETVGEQVGRISNTFDQRLTDIEASDNSESVGIVREEIAKLSETVEDRLDEIEAREATAIEKVGDEMGKLADTLETRIVDSEHRSAVAIEQVGEQVSRVATRLQSRQDDALKTFSDKLEESRERSETRLSDALSNVSKRLELMQDQTSSSLSPVQKAIASLATRLESLEDFAAPPFAETGKAEPLPEMPSIPTNEPLFDNVDIGFDTADIGTDASAEMDTVQAAGLVSEEVTVDDFMPGIESWDDLAEETPQIDVDVNLDAPEMEAESVDAPPFETEYIADVPGEDDETYIDPVAELENWDDGRSEARDGDIFDDQFDTPEELEATENAPPPEPAQDPVLSAAETQQEDFIAYARRAAREAADGGAPQDVGTRGKKSKAPKAGKTKNAKPLVENSKKGPPLPLIAAASAIALTAAGATAFLHLRGQDDVDVQTISKADLTPASALESADGMDGGTDQVSTAALPVGDMDEDLFEEDGGVDAGALEAAADAEPTEDEIVSVKAETPVEAEPATVAAVRPTIGRITPPQTLAAAAENGDQTAMYLLGAKRLDANDYASGANLIRKSAEKGTPAAQYRLAKLHEKGLGVPRDLRESRKWTEKAAQNGNVKAMHDLAVFYAQGDGGPQSYAGAVEWFRKAAEYGVVDSQYNVGVLYEEGLGVSPDLTEALVWYDIAARGGDAGAPAKLNALREKVDYEISQTAQRRAAAWSAKKADGPTNGEFATGTWGRVTPDQIANVQGALNAFGYTVGTPDGAIGPATAKAIRKFEAENGLKETGEVNAALINKINEVSGAARG